MSATPSAESTTSAQARISTRATATSATGPVDSAASTVTADASSQPPLQEARVGERAGQPQERQNQGQVGERLAVEALGHQEQRDRGEHAGEVQPHEALDR